MKCYFCNKEVDETEWNAIVKEAIKPPKMPYRYKAVGKACEECCDSNIIIIDKFNNKE
jgi:hypothetical protein